ncbi:MAG: hypothetical protein ABIA78_04310 [archaeon]
MSNQNLIHIKLGYDEALESKRKLLISEKELLGIARVIRNYKTLRINELKQKSKLQRKIKILKTTLGKLQKFFPRIEPPHVIKSTKKGKKTQINPEYDNIELQLQEIQAKLRALQ